MGVYLNSKSPYLLFRWDCGSAYFIDKSNILKELVCLVDWEENRPENLLDQFRTLR